MTRDNIAPQTVPEYMKRVSDTNVEGQLGMYPEEVKVCAIAMVAIDATAFVRNEPMLDDAALNKAVLAWFSAYMGAQP